MAELSIDDPDKYRQGAPVDDRGRVSIGKEFSGEEVNIAVEVVSDE